MKRRTLLNRVGKRGGFAALVVSALLAGPVSADERGIDDFPPGKGREETANYCAACHSGRLVSQQGMTRAQWDGTLDIMTERHKMPKLEGEERALILDYLAASFPPRRGRTPNPFLQQ